MYNRVEQIGLVYYIDPNKVTINKDKYVKVTLKEREPFKDVEGNCTYMFLTCYVSEAYAPFISENKLIFFKGRLKPVSEQTIFVVDDFRHLDAKYLEEK